MNILLLTDTLDAQLSQKPFWNYCRLHWLQSTRVFTRIFVHYRTLKLERRFILMGPEFIPICKHVDCCTGNQISSQKRFVVNLGTST